jgi:hypothetical protein
MQHIHFRTEDAVDVFLKRYIDRIPGIEKTYYRLLAELIKDEIKEMDLPDVKEGMLGLMIPQFKYVIKDEDLPILESLLDGLKTAAGANFFMAASTGDVNKSWVAAIGVFGTLYKLYKNIRNKGKILPSLAFHVLLCLKNYPEGLELSYLRFLLEKNEIKLGEEELRQLLDGLSKTYMHDGSKKELVIMEGYLYKVRGI